MSEIYSEPETYGLSHKDMTLNNKGTVLVVVDPQIDLLSPQDIGWKVFEDSITENNIVGNLEALFKMAKEAQMPVFISPHHYFPHDHKWQSTAPGEAFMHDTGMFSHRDPSTVENLENSGVDFLPQFKPCIYDGKTVIASPRKTFGPETSDLVLQLRKRSASQVILAGVATNLYIESHMRELIEQGFEVVVAKGATAGPRIPKSDGYLAALTSYRIIANDLQDTGTTVEKVKVAAK